MKTGKLTVKGIENLAAGRYGDGGGVWLQVRSATSRSWVFRYVRGGKEHWIGLGDASVVGLAKARQKGLKWRQVLDDGRDPLAVKREEEAAQKEGAEDTWFENVAAKYIKAHSPSWKNAKHADQWESTLTTYAYPKIGKTSVRDLKTEHILKVLTPIWTSKSETASRVRGRIEAILGFAAAQRWRDQFNPAAWTNLKPLLPAKGKIAKVEHHAALPYFELCNFIAANSAKCSISANALRYTILTAARTGEVLGARWSEIDLTAKVWTVPAGRMKAGREHRIPLSAPALAILTAMGAHKPKSGDGYIFPGQRPEKPLSNMAMTMLVRGSDWPAITVHGFRSTFRDWAGEKTTFQREVIESALAHTVGGVEGAYQRGDYFHKREKLMAAWGAYCMAKTAGNVVPMNARA
jgi:integrase